MAIDFPRAWEICLSTLPEEHHRDCSYRTHKLLCDCDVIFKHVEYLDPYRFYSKGGICTYDSTGSVDIREE